MKVSNKGAFRHEIISSFGLLSEDDIRVNKKTTKLGKDFYNSYDDDDDSRSKRTKPTLQVRLKGEN